MLVKTRAISGWDVKSITGVAVTSGQTCLLSSRVNTEERCGESFDHPGWFPTRFVNVR